MTEPKERAAHATTWGQPRRERSPVFHRVIGRWFAVTGTACRYTAYGLAVSALLLLVYAGVFVERVRAHAADGTVFSCELPILRGQ
ncbi:MULTISPECIES: hypothetical protein [Cupriavidus]